MITRICAAAPFTGFRGGKSSMKNSGNNTTSPVDTTPATDTVSFRGSVTYPINSSRIYKDYGDIFHDGVKLIDKRLLRAKLSGGLLRGADLTGSDFTKSSFYACLMQGVNLTRGKFTYAKLEGCQLDGLITEDTEFLCTNLSGCTFTGDRMMPGTNMQKANLTSANFKDANVDNIDFINAIYDEYTRFPSGFDPKAEHMRLLEKGADFSNLTKELQRVKLRCLVFDTVNLENSDLKRADLMGNNFRNCNMHNTDLTRAYAKEAIFENCDLSGSKLKQLNLHKAELINCDLRNCNLKGAILDLHQLYNTNLKGAKYDQFTKIEGFNPKDHGMIYEESNLSYYGIRG